MNRVGVIWLFYTTFIDVIEQRDFTVIFPIFQRNCRDFADFYRDFLAALKVRYVSASAYRRHSVGCVFEQGPIAGNSRVAECRN